MYGQMFRRVGYWNNSKLDDMYHTFSLLCLSGWLKFELSRFLQKSLHDKTLHDENREPEKNVFNPDGIETNVFNLNIGRWNRFFPSLECGINIYADDKVNNW